MVLGRRFDSCPVGSRKKWNMKVILKCDKDKLSQAMMAAQELITQKYDSMEITIAGITYWVYQTKMGTVVVRQNDPNRA